MTRLTLRWHLRGIVEGTVEPVCVRQDIEYGPGDRYWPTAYYYADPHVEENNEQRLYDDAHSYTTGFTQESGDFCDAYERRLARDALRSDDPVAFLDGVAYDPAERPDRRTDAAGLLSRHIMPREDDGHRLPVDHWSTVRCPDCYEGEYFPIDPQTGAVTCWCGTEMKPAEAETAG